jgi:hypothetical protein
MSAIGSVGLKTSEFLIVFLSFGLIALSGLDINDGVVSFHLDLMAAVSAMGGGTVYAGLRTALKHKAAPSTEPQAAPTKEEVATEVLKQLQTPKETSE